MISGPTQARLHLVRMDHVPSRTLNTDRGPRHVYAARRRSGAPEMTVKERII